MQRRDRTGLALAGPTTAFLVAAFLGGCASSLPGNSAAPSYPVNTAGGDPSSAFGRIDTARLPYDGFDSRPLLATPAFKPEPDTRSEERRTRELLAQSQHDSMVAAGTVRSTQLPLDSGVPAQGRSYAVGTGPGYWDQNGLAWGSPGNTTLGPGTVVSEDDARIKSSGRRPTPQQIGPLTVPETLSTDSDSVGTGGASIPPPPDAKPGECFALVRKPALYRTTQRDFELRPPADRLQIDPARYVTATQTVTTQDAYERLEVVPATFRYVTEQVEVAPATTRYVASEPVYQTVTERIEERPARSVWKLGRGKIEKIDNATGQIMCLVEEPAQYRTLTRQVLAAPAETREIVQPAQYRTITRRVIDRPAQVRRVSVPAEQSTLPVAKVVQEAQITRVPVPGAIASYGVKELVSPAELEWRPVLCETNMTADVIRRVQVQLVAAGFDPGYASGTMNAQTIAALNGYQRQRGLPEDRYLNVETARALGVWR